MNNERKTKTRRNFLGAVGAVALGGACGTEVDANTATGPSGSTSSTGGGDGGAGLGGQGGQGGEGGLGNPMGAGGSGPLQCTPSDDNILGPYYRADAPFRTDLTELNMPGTRISVSGRVLDAECQPIAGALIDVWQADDDGDYDNDGVNDPPPDVFVLRGRMTADGDGSYGFRTLIPGHYLNGNQFRPAHLHVKVSAPGYVALTTQLYFEGDPYNDIDPWFLPTLMLLLADAGNEKVSSFDFVLQTA